MPPPNAQIERVKQTIDLLESLRDKLLKEGAGPQLSDDLFRVIDELYELLLKIQGQRREDNE